MTDETTDRTTHEEKPVPSPALQPLERLIGTWDVELRFAVDPPGTVQAEARFEWLEGGAFLLEQFGGSRWVMGADDASQTCGVLYHDDRGVCRVYQMSLVGDVWLLWRDAPGFSQRFEGRFSADGSSITAYWQRSTDGTTWAHDFDLTYTKRTGSSPTHGYNEGEMC